MKRAAIGKRNEEAAHSHASVREYGEKLVRRVPKHPIECGVLRPKDAADGIDENPTCWPEELPALTADGSKRGVSDAAIDNGMSPASAAAAILAAIEAGRRELVLATGMELDIAVLRRSDPEALFDRVSAMVRAGYVKQMAAGSSQD